MADIQVWASGRLPFSGASPGLRGMSLKAGLRIPVWGLIPRALDFPGINLGRERVALP